MVIQTPSLKLPSSCQKGVATSEGRKGPANRARIANQPRSAHEPALGDGGEGGDLSGVGPAASGGQDNADDDSDCFEEMERFAQDWLRKASGLDEETDVGFDRAVREDAEDIGEAVVRDQEDNVLSSVLRTTASQGKGSDELPGEQAEEDRFDDLADLADDKRDSLLAAIHFGDLDAQSHSSSSTELPAASSASLELWWEQFQIGLSAFKDAAHALDTVLLGGTPCKGN